MAPIAGDWQEALKGEFHQPYYAKLYKTVMTEYRTRKIFPPPEDGRTRQYYRSEILFLIPKAADWKETERNVPFPNGKEHFWS